MSLWGFQANPWYRIANHRSVKTHPKSFARADPEKVSYHLNRVGFHFPSTIVDQAMNWIGIELNGRSRAGIANNLGRRLRRYGQQPERVAVITAMKDLFPKMPHESVDIIVEHAFEQVPCSLADSFAKL